MWEGFNTHQKGEVGYRQHWSQFVTPKKKCTKLGIWITNTAAYCGHTTFPFLNLKSRA